jgi:DNA repair protein RecO (recombination protein O)
MLCGYYAAELMLNFTIEGEPCPGLYALLVDVLGQVAAGRALGANLLRLELGVLLDQGLAPRFDACALCGRGLRRRGPVLFSSAEGGPVCGRCEARLWAATGEAPDRRRATHVGAEQLRALAAFDPRRGPEPMSAEQTLAMGAVVRFHIRDLLGRELRMWPYMHQRKLSRSLAQLGRQPGA